MARYSLLSEPAFRVRWPDGTAVRMSLPEILAALSSGADLSFLWLRPHQRPVWHAFLVQLAYLGLEQNEHPSPHEPAEWVALLRGLTDEHADDVAWCLLNPDWQQPAFLQAPCSPARQADFKRGTDFIQDIDVLVTSRHHDEKGSKQPIDEANLDALVYALIALQGWSPFLGAGNYSTMRMNGGFSSRPQFRLAFERGSGAEFLRDLEALREPATMQVLSSEARAVGFGIAPDGAHGLLWLSVWDEGSMHIRAVHPYALEVCRRIRLIEQGGQLRLMRAGSSGMRVEAKALRGAVLDPWVPLVRDKDDYKALTAQRHTFGYRTLQSLLFDRSKTTLPVLARFTDHERQARAGQSATLIAQVLVSGDGGTDGLLSREVQLPPAVRQQWASDEAKLGTRSRRFVEIAGIAIGKVYRPALFQFVGGGEEIDFQNRDIDRTVQPWINRVEAAIDDIFFGDLFASFNPTVDDQAAQARWTSRLELLLRSEFAVAVDALPTHDDTRFFADVRAESFMSAAARKHLNPFKTASEAAVTPA